MERQLLPDDHLTEAVHHLVEEAVLLAGGHTPDARHLLLAILKTHAPTVQQLLPDIKRPSSISSPSPSDARTSARAPTLCGGRDTRTVHRKRLGRRFVRLRPRLFNQHIAYLRQHTPLLPTPKVVVDGLPRG